MDKENLQEENVSALKLGIPNLLKHIKNIKDVYNLPVVVAINKYTTDTNAEIEAIKEEVNNLGVEAICCNVWGEGGKGAIDLAQKVISLCEEDNSQFNFSYNVHDDIKTKINDIATKIYGASKVNYTEKALADLKDIESLGCDKLPIIIAKTQYSLSDDAKVLGSPTDFEINIQELQLRSGAGFIVAIAGSMLLMPGLPKVPAGAKMKIDSNNVITGLF